MPLDNGIFAYYHGVVNNKASPVGEATARIWIAAAKLWRHGQLVNRFRRNQGGI